MNVIENEYNIIISASEGQLLTFRGDPSGETFLRYRTPNKNFDITKIVEVKGENVKPYIPEIPINLENKSLDEIQKYIILQTKNILRDFLETNPLEFQGEFYTASLEKQNALHSVIKAAEYAQELNIPYTPYWSSTKGIRQPYSLDTLKMLFIKMQIYIVDLVRQQQLMENAILENSNILELLNFNISYSIN